METEVLKVSGMTGDACVRKVTHALDGLPGVQKINVSLSAGIITVHYDESMIAPDRLQAIVAGAGYGVETTMPLSVVDTGTRS
jgi:copper chaperone CopZ